MKVIGIIPARMAATRFPGKPLAKLLNMPMIGHCYHRTRLSPGLDAVYVATCDEPIAEYVRSIGGKPIMTAETHKRATTRTAEAMELVEKETGERIDIVVMVQGDEPLILPETIGDTIGHFKDPNVSIVNVMSKFRSYEAFVDKNNVKVVVDQSNNALYFSREPIPSPWKGWQDHPRFQQTGIIAFRRDTLLQYNVMQETPLEQCESVDMNRVLETGGSIKMVLTEAFALGIDTPEELAVGEQHLKTDPTLSRYMAL